MHSIHSDYQKTLKDIVAYFHTLAVHPICIKECLWDWIYHLQFGNLIFMLYSSVLQSRKYCETIMDDLLLFTPLKKSHIAKLEDLKLKFYAKTIKCVS